MTCPSCNTGPELVELHREAKAEYDEIMSRYERPGDELRDRALTLGLALKRREACPLPHELVELAAAEMAAGDEEPVSLPTLEGEPEADAAAPDETETEDNGEDRQEPVREEADVDAAGGGDAPEGEAPAPARKRRK